MKRFLVCLCIYALIVTNLQAQFKDISRPDVSGRFLAFISPISTESDINALLDTLEGKGFKVSIQHLVFTDQGQLKSFHARLVSECGDDGYTFDGTTDFAKKNVFPIAGLFIGEDCSSGVFTVPFENVKKLYSAFFPTRDPELLLYGWDGDFEAAEGVSMAANFTISSVEEH